MWVKFYLCESGTTSYCLIKFLIKFILTFLATWSNSSNNLVLIILYLFNKAPILINQPIWRRLAYHYISITIQRFKYYTAWELADAVNVASGLGFSGFDENGHSKWDCIKKFIIFKRGDTLYHKMFNL
jgi:hypothetical protein